MEVNDIEPETDQTGQFQETGHSQTKYLSEYLCKDSYSVFSYPGYSVNQFLEEDVIFEVVPFFSVVVIVVGANDIGRKTPSEIASDIEHLCQTIHLHSPSAKLLVSEILPRSQNEFDGCRHRLEFLDQWNRDACSVNRQLHKIAGNVTCLNIIRHPEFYTLFGARRSMLSKDGLHLSYDGTQQLTSTIEMAVRSTTTKPCSAVSTCVPHSTSSFSTVKYRSSFKHQSPTITRTPRSVSPCVNDLPSAPAVNNLTLRRKKGKPTLKRPLTSGLRTTKKRSSGTKHYTVKSKNHKQSVFTSAKIKLLETNEKYVLNIDTSCEKKRIIREVPLVGGGKDATVFSQTDRKLTHHEAADILIQNLPDSITKEPPYRPAAGEVYLYDDCGNTNAKEDWRADGYTWRNLGKRQYETNDEKKIERTFFKICNQGVASDDFQKHVFRFIDEDYNGRTVLVYYGNHEAYKELPHGNRKKGNRNRQYKRTKPSVMKEIKIRSNGENPNKLCEKMRSEKSPDTQIRGVGVPKNDRQIKNAQAKLRKENVLSHDALYALHLLVDQLDNYVLSIKTTPDLEVVVGSNELFDELNKLLQLNDVTMNIFYDTTFNLGDFYVSTMAIQHPMFKEKPVIPIAFMIHERKYQTCHEHFIDIVKSKVSKLSQRNINVVTDREKGIINAFEERLSNSQVLICWNHILNDIKFWVKKHGGGADDIKVYEMNVRSLLQCENKDEFEEKYAEMKLKWSEAFVTYFDEHIHDTIIGYAARWILEHKGIYNPYSGITNNVSESLNAQLKRLIDRKEKRIDEIVLYFYYMQGNSLSKLILAFCGESEWTLNSHFKFASLDPDTVILPKNVCHPDKLVDLIRGKLISLVKNTNNVTTNKINSEEQQIDNTDEIKDEPIKKSEGPSSQKSLAAKIIIDNDIVLVPQMGAFMVKGTKDKNHSVTLFPKENCTCPSTSRCYHIIAAMMAIGMPLPEDKKVYNLTQLRRNCRPKHQKKCGTKKGRKGDTELDKTVVAAPDSVAKSEIKSDFIDTPVNLKERKTIRPNSNVKKSLFDMTTPNSTKSLINSTPKTPRSILKNKNSSNNKRKLQFQDENCVKIPKLEADLSVISENNDLVTLESSRDESCDMQETFNLKSKWWVEELQLTIEDKSELLKGGKLNSHHMEAVNKLLRKQVGNTVNGLQLTEKVPFFNDNENRWKTKFPFDPVEESPACQIHHTHNDHWVVSLFHESKVYLLDSLGNDRNIDRIIPDGLKIQMSQIYGRNVKCLSINLPSVMKQTNSIDCGLFAVAFATSYCFRKTLCYDIIFDTKALRNHLLQCFENNKMTEFPLTSKTLGIRRRKNLRVTTVEQYCICNMPACIADMVQCDKCLCWYHKFCVNAPSDISRLDEDFRCGLC